jgi:DNA-binding transcriptional MerR regulator
MEASDYTIAEAARATGLSPHTLRYYERIGLLEPVARLPNGHRRYTDDDLWWLGFVALTAATGMPVRRIRRFVTLERAGTREAQVALLENERDRLVRELHKVRANLASLERKLAHYRREAMPPGDSARGSSAAR